MTYNVFGGTLNPAKLKFLFFCLLPLKCKKTLQHPGLCPRPCWKSLQLILPHHRYQASSLTADSPSSLFTMHTLAATSLWVSYLIAA